MISWDFMPKSGIYTTGIYFVYFVFMFLKLIFVQKYYLHWTFHVDRHTKILKGIQRLYDLMA